MKCSRCSREITEEEAFAYEGKELCEDCLMEIGLHPKECEPWATYLATRERTGMKSAEGLTDLESDNRLELIITFHQHSTGK